MKRRISLVTALAAIATPLLTAAPALAKGGSRDGGYLDAKGVVAASGLQTPPRAIVGPPGSGLLYIAQPSDEGVNLARVDTAGGGI